MRATWLCRGLLLRSSQKDTVRVSSQKYTARVISWRRTESKGGAGDVQAAEPERGHEACRRDGDAVRALLPTVIYILTCYAKLVPADALTGSCK